MATMVTMTAVEDPPPEAYSRVTDPGRYAVLHAAADALLDELVERYVVERVDGPEADEELAHEPLVARVVRLHPEPHGAPLVVAFTSFPGLHVRYGRWHEELYPHCGCDACDEAPADLLGELTERAAALVAGQFTEEAHLRPRPERRFMFLGRAGGWTTMTEEWATRVAAEAPGPSVRHEWLPWRVSTRRSAPRSSPTTMPSTIPPRTRSGP